MRILWLKSDLLLPLDKGGKLRTWHLMRHLAARHDITYVSFQEPGQPRADVEGMREVSARVVTVPRADAPKWSWRFHADVVRHLPSRLPYAIAKYRSRRLHKVLDRLLRDEPFDLVVCDFLCAAINLPRPLNCPAVIFTHNVESEIWRRHSLTDRYGWQRVFYRSQYRRMLEYEGRTLAAFDGVLAVSETDRLTFGNLYPGALKKPAQIVPTGVDTDYFKPAPFKPASFKAAPDKTASDKAAPDERRPRHIVFTGSMDWLPNQDAMVFFCRQVLPLIRQEEPEVELSIVGRAPTRPVTKLADDPAVHVTGRVEDVRPYVERATVYVCPIRIGGGTRLKIFEAMAMGKAVVSTTIGAEGLDVVNGRDLVIADDAGAFARAVVRLIRDSESRRAIERAARALVVRRYDWSAVAGELEAALLRFARQGGVPAPFAQTVRTA